MEIIMFYKSKTNVSVLQLGLLRAGYYSSEVDGIFGRETQDALNRLKSDYSIDENENDYSKILNVLKPFLSGYTTHIVKSGDSFYSIAKMHNTDIDSIKYANPYVKENNLIIGTKIIVPLGAYVTVTNLNYNSFLTECIITGIAVRYPFIQCVPIGKSVWGNMIYLLKIGAGDRQVFFNAEHHANEWITTPLVLKFIEDYAKVYLTGSGLASQNALNLYNSVTLFAVAAVNPDGIDIVNDAADPNMLKDVISFSQNYPSIEFPSGWKANANGVDLNLQYPAGWENAKKIKYSMGYTLPGPRDFVGQNPLEEPECRCVYDLTIQNQFVLTISYHTQGAVIYWKFLDYNPENSRKIGVRLADASGYELEDTPYSSGYAGYKDWFIQTYIRPGYTVEAGTGVNPLPIGDFDTLYAKNYPLMAQAFESAAEL